MYAVWEKVVYDAYTLSFNVNGGTGIVAPQSCQRTTVAGTCSVTIPSTKPTRTNYKFLGWANSASATSAIYQPEKSITLSASKTIYAIWAPVRKLSFNVNGGTGSVAAQSCYPTTTTGSCTVTIPPTTPTRDDYYFLGWNTSSSATSASSNYSGGSVTLSESNTTIYAIWVPVYKLTFNYNYSVTPVEGSIKCHPTTTTGSCNVTIPSAAPTRSNYDFLGWADSSTATTADYQPSTSITLRASETIYAIWKAQEIVSFVFPNIYNSTDYFIVDDGVVYNKNADGSRGNERGKDVGNAIIMKTKGDKYVLLDTGPSGLSIQQAIYHRLMTLQNKTRVTIDYLIISHLDVDHYGNVVALINNSNITINNLVIKHERYPDDDSNNVVTGPKEQIFLGIISAAASKGIKTYIGGDHTKINNTGYATYLANNYPNLNREDFGEDDNMKSIVVDEYLTLHLFNTGDSYKDKPNCAVGTRITWTASIRQDDTKYIRDTEGNYIYFDGDAYNGTNDRSIIQTAETLVTKSDGSGISRYFYAFKTDNNQICRSNPNSLAILADVASTGVHKYAYFPGDVENAGYSAMASGGNSTEMYQNIVFDNTNKVFKNKIQWAPGVGAEIKAASAVRSKILGDGNSLNDIVIYQMSHHGLNNSDEAVSKLDLNRETGIYAIEENSVNMSDTVSWNYTKTWYYTLGEVGSNRLRVGRDAYNRVNCSVTMEGSTKCKLVANEDSSQ